MSGGIDPDDGDIPGPDNIAGGTDGMLVLEADDSDDEQFPTVTQQDGDEAATPRGGTHYAVRRPDGSDHPRHDSNSPAGAVSGHSGGRVDTGGSRASKGSAVNNGHGERISPSKPPSPQTNGTPTSSNCDGRGTVPPQSTTASPDDYIEDSDIEEDEHTEYQEQIDIPKDSFSMLWVGNSCADSILPIMVFILQFMILVLIFYNLLQDSEVEPLSNAMNIPVGVPLTVTLSQYIACLVAVITADDLIQGMLYMGKRIIHTGYSPVDGVLPPISWKWELSNTMRLAEGALTIGVSFIFIIQSSTVIDLFLNFAGVTFVGFLDDTCFLLAQYGLLGRRAKCLAKDVSNFEVYKKVKGGLEKKMGIIRAIIFVGITVALWAGLSVVVWQQSSMLYACQSVTVSVGGLSAHPWARHFSGNYIRIETLWNWRAQYYKKQGASAFLRYDKGTKRWGISFEADEGDYSLMSERTTAFDISEVEEFRFWTDEFAEAEVRCNDCNPKLLSETCSWEGDCNKETKSCVCDPGYFGVRCQYVSPCSELIMEVGFEGSESVSFDLLYHEDEPMLWLGFPVYTQAREVSWRYMFYGGGFWNVIEVEDYSPADIFDYLNNVGGDYDVLYFSEPSISSSPANLAFRAKLAADWSGNWNDDEYTAVSHSAVARLSEKEFFFFCADCFNGTEGISICTDESGNANYSICERVESKHVPGTVNRCNCPRGFSGTLCEIRPVEGTIKLHLDYGDGVCLACGEANDRSLWDLGIEGTCLPYPTNQPLSFKGTNGTFVRQMGLRLNGTHFSLFVSSNVADVSDLCTLKDGTKEIFSINRTITNRTINRMSTQIKFDQAIYFNNDNNDFGKIVDPEGIECKVEANVDQSVCDAADLLQHAWVWLDVKVTPS